MRAIEPLPDVILALDNKIAVLIPCFNEDAAIATVVAGFRATLPRADIFVYDNNSTDRTIAVAQEAGATVRRELRQGKGHVVRRMFADIDADIYVLVDGDATYDAPSAATMVTRLVDELLDMIVAVRTDQERSAYRAGHRLGNRVLTDFVGHVFGRTFTDILSGYRVFSRRYVKSFPALSRGFEIETELTVHALELGLPVAELETPYYSRPEGSTSKLNTYRDGLRILWTIARLYKSERPISFFSFIGAALAVLAVALGIPLVINYVETGLVLRVPTAMLCTGLIVLASLSLTCGLILSTVTRGRREIKRLAYLAQPSPIANRATGKERR
jgi:glycosyltransferase involved in cell wall biosynthesis